MADCDEKVYVYAVNGLQARLTRINQIVEGLELAMIDVVTKGGIEEYTIDDGQVKIMTTYRSAKDVAAAITGWELIRNRIMNQLNGRGMVLRPWEGLM